MSAASNGAEHGGPPERTLQLTELEKTLSQLLLDVAEYVDQSPPVKDVDSQVTLPKELAEARLELRFTGGWVRDKLLGVDSHDIDVAINKMTGYQFGLRLKDYLEISGNPAKYGLEGLAETASQSAEAGKTAKSKQVGGLHKIEANPEKSKHLETVTTRILGLDIDLVNLRKETYTEESRNPQMEFGTPEEDALRRDCTVNAMFYNLNKSIIEDLTGRGFEDMQRRIIRTPLEPFQTFKDDPLRVLRLIRFASRLEYTIDPAAEECMGDEVIKDALKMKISRERVGVELEKMLKGPHPDTALALIDRLGLYETVFSDPTATDSAYRPQLENWTATIAAVKDLQADGATEPRSSIRSTLIRNAEEEHLAWLLAAFVPYADAPNPESAKAGGKPPPPVATSVAREGIKATNRVCDVITASVRNLEEILSLKGRAVTRIRYPHRHVEGEDASARDVLGMAIRRWGASWRSQVVYALLYEVSNAPDSEEGILRDYATFLTHLSTLSLLEAYTLKPLLDGKQLAKALSTPPGPWMKDALDVVMAWQLRNPTIQSPEAAIEEARAKQNQNQKQDGGELSSQLVAHFLRLTIRPLFAQTPHPAVTPAGRKSIRATPMTTYSASSSDATMVKPWKSRDRYALDLLRWCLRQLDAQMVERDWPLLIPPLLTIVDDEEPAVKAVGCELLMLLLERTPPALLERTGLAQVIEDALMPCLSYLPTLTPTEESVRLLDAAFPALLTLARVRFPIESKQISIQGSAAATSTSKSRSRPATATAASPALQKAKFLDALLRKGVLTGYAHAGTHVRVAETLLTHLAAIITELGIQSVKHLKHVLPLLADVLGDPFGPAYPPLLLAAARALRSVVLNAWPRIGVWKGGVLRGVCVSWRNVCDAEGEREKEGLEEVRRELRAVVEVLGEAVEGEEEVELRAELEGLVEVDGRLEGLFKDPEE